MDWLWIGYGLVALVAWWWIARRLWCWADWDLEGADLVFVISIGSLLAVMWPIGVPISWLITHTPKEPQRDWEAIGNRIFRVKDGE